MNSELDFILDFVCLFFLLLWRRESVFLWGKGAP